jgi:hypothetical protein
VFTEGTPAQWHSLVRLHPPRGATVTGTSDSRCYTRLNSSTGSCFRVGVVNIEMGTEMARGMLNLEIGLNNEIPS